MNAQGVTPMSRSELIEQYKTVRAFTEKLCAPLETEDQVIQSMPGIGSLSYGFPMAGL